MSTQFYDIKPSGLLIGLADLPRLQPTRSGPDTPPDDSCVQVPQRAERRTEWMRIDDDSSVVGRMVDSWGPDLAQLAAIMTQPGLDGASFDLALQRVLRTAPQMRTISSTYRALRDARENCGPDPIQAAWIDSRLAALAPWYDTDQYTRLVCRITSPRPLSPTVLDLVSNVLYGSPHCAEGPRAGTYLADCWPGTSLRFLRDLPAIAAAKAERSRRLRRHAAAARCGIRLGTAVTDNVPAILETPARSQHVYLIGGTGTGKSTLMANMIAQDMERGDSVVVIDPHGRLVEEVAKLVPPRRRRDVQLLHPTDPAGAFTLNVLAPLGPDLALERNRAANDLLAFMKMIYPEPREAFGPMFENYYRNAVFLVLAGREKQATLADIRRVFLDSAFRKDLRDKCPDSDVRQFWQRIAGESGRASDFVQIENVAPYIDAKLSQLSGNPLIQRIVGNPRTTIDFGRVADRRGICLVNLALNEIGDEDARILGGLLFGHLTRQLKSIATGRREGELPLRVYLDEVQTYADERLAQSMAQMRKFGVTYTLANQNLAQVAGAAWRPSVLHEILGNCANLLAFRIGHQDALCLAPWFGEAVTPTQLVGLPNYQAATRMLCDGQPLDPFVIRTDPPRTSRVRPRRGPALPQQSLA